MNQKIFAILVILLFINLPLTTALSYTITGRPVSDFPSDFNPPPTNQELQTIQPPTEYYTPQPVYEIPQEKPTQPSLPPKIPPKELILTGFCGDKYCDREGVYNKPAENELTCPEDCPKATQELVESTCTDSDGDEIMPALVPGQVTGVTITNEPFREEDICLFDENGNLFLKEYSCDEKGFSKEENIYCPEIEVSPGKKVEFSCFDGACRQVSCEDTVEGAKYSYPDGRQTLQENKCQGNQLLKFTCKGSEIVECQYGCNSLENNCFDKSKKSNYCIELKNPLHIEIGEVWLDEKGNTQTKAESYPDYCNDKVLNHFSCEGTINRLRSTYCPNGCDPVKQDCVPSTESVASFPKENSPQNFLENLQQGLVCLKQCPDCMDKPQPPKGIDCKYILSSGVWPIAPIPQWPLMPFVKKDKEKPIIIDIADAIKEYEEEQKNKDSARNLLTGKATQQDPEKWLFDQIYGGVMNFIEGLIKVQEDNNAVGEINKISQCLPPLDPEIEKAKQYLSTCSDDSAIIALMNAVNQINQANGNLNDAYKHLVYGASPFTEEFISKLFDAEGWDTDFAIRQSKQRGEKQKSRDLENLKKAMNKITPTNLKYDLQDSIKTFDNVNNQVLVDSLNSVLEAMPQAACPGVNNYLDKAKQEIELVKFYDEEFKKGINQAKAHANSIGGEIRSSIFKAMVGNTFVNYAAHQNVRASLSGVKASVAILNAVLESVKCIKCPLAQAKYVNEKGTCVDCAKCGPGRMPAVSSQLSLPELRKAELAKALQEGDFEKVKKIIDKLKGQEVVPEKKNPGILTSERIPIVDDVIDSFYYLWKKIKIKLEVIPTLTEQMQDPALSEAQKIKLIRNFILNSGVVTDYEVPPSGTLEALKEIILIKNIPDGVIKEVVESLELLYQIENRDLRNEIIELLEEILSGSELGEEQKTIILDNFINKLEMRSTYEKDAEVQKDLEKLEKYKPKKTSYKLETISPFLATRIGREPFNLPSILKSAAPEAPPEKVVEPDLAKTVKDLINVFIREKNKPFNELVTSLLTIAQGLELLRFKESVKLSEMNLSLLAETILGIYIDNKDTLALGETHLILYALETITNISPEAMNPENIMFIFEDLSLKYETQKNQLTLSESLGILQLLNTVLYKFNIENEDQLAQRIVNSLNELFDNHTEELFSNFELLKMLDDILSVNLMPTYQTIQKGELVDVTGENRVSEEGRQLIQKIARKLLEHFENNKKTLSTEKVSELFKLIDRVLFGNFLTKEEKTELNREASLKLFAFFKENKSSLTESEKTQFLLALYKTSYDIKDTASDEEKGIILALYEDLLAINYSSLSEEEVKDFLDNFLYYHLLVKDTQEETVLKQVTIKTLNYFLENINNLSPENLFRLSRHASSFINSFSGFNNDEKNEFADKFIQKINEYLEKHETLPDDQKQFVKERANNEFEKIKSIISLQKLFEEIKNKRAEKESVDKKTPGESARILKTQIGTVRKPVEVLKTEEVTKEEVKPVDEQKVKAELTGLINEIDEMINSFYNNPEEAKKLMDELINSGEFPALTEFDPELTDEEKLNTFVARRLLGRLQSYKDRISLLSNERDVQAYFEMLLNLYKRYNYFITSIIITEYETLEFTKCGDKECTKEPTRLKLTRSLGMDFHLDLLELAKLLSEEHRQNYLYDLFDLFTSISEIPLKAKEKYLLEVYSLMTEKTKEAYSSLIFTELHKLYQDRIKEGGLLLEIIKYLPDDRKKEKAIQILNELFSQLEIGLKERTLPNVSPGVAYLIYQLLEMTKFPPELTTKAYFLLKDFGFYYLLSALERGENLNVSELLKTLTTLLSHANINEKYSEGTLPSNIYSQQIDDQVTKLLEYIQEQINSLSRLELSTEQAQETYINLINALTEIKKITDLLPDSDSPYAPKPKLVNKTKQLLAQLVNLIVQKRIPPTQEFYDLISRIEDIGLRESLLKLLKLNFGEKIQASVEESPGEIPAGISEEGKREITKQIKVVKSEQKYPVQEIPSKQPTSILKSEQKGWFGRTWDWISGVKSPEEESSDAKKTVLDPDKTLEDKISALYVLAGPKGDETNFQDLKELLFNPNVSDEIKLRIIIHLYIFLNQQQFLKEHSELMELIKKELITPVTKGNEGAFIEILSWYDVNHLFELFKNPNVSDLNKLYLIKKIMKLRQVKADFAYSALDFLKTAIHKEENRKFLSWFIGLIINLQSFENIGSFAKFFKEEILKYELSPVERTEILEKILDSNRLNKYEKREIIKTFPEAESTLEYIIKQRPYDLDLYEINDQIIQILSENGKFEVLKKLLNIPELHKYYKILIAEQLWLAKELLDTPELIDLLISVVPDTNVPLEVRSSAIRALLNKEGTNKFKELLLNPQLSSYAKRTIIEALGTLAPSFFQEIILDQRIDLDIKKEALHRGAKGFSYPELMQIALNQELEKEIRDLAITNLINFDSSLLVKDLIRLPYEQRIAFLKEILFNKSGGVEYEQRLLLIVQDLSVVITEEDSIELYRLIIKNLGTELAIKILAKIGSNPALDILEELLKERIAREPFKNSSIKNQLTEVNLDVGTLILLINTFNYWSETGENANIRSNSYRARDYLLELLEKKVSTTEETELAKYYDLAKSFLLPKYFAAFINFVAFLPFEKSIEELRRIYYDENLIEQAVNNSGLSYEAIMEIIINTLSVNDEKAIKVLEEIANNPEEESSIRESARKIVEHFMSFEEVPTKEKKITSTEPPSEQDLRHLAFSEEQIKKESSLEEVSNGFFNLDQLIKITNSESFKEQVKQVLLKALREFIFDENLSEYFRTKNLHYLLKYGSGEDFKKVLQLVNNFSEDSAHYSLINNLFPEWTVDEENVKHRKQKVLEELNKHTSEVVRKAAKRELERLFNTKPKEVSSIQTKQPTELFYISDKPKINHFPIFKDGVAKGFVNTANEILKSEHAKAPSKGVSSETPPKEMQNFKDLLDYIAATLQIPFITPVGIFFPEGMPQKENFNYHVDRIIEWMENTGLMNADFLIELMELPLEEAVQKMKERIESILDDDLEVEVISWKIEKGHKEGTWKVPKEEGMSYEEFGQHAVGLRGAGTYASEGDSETSPEGETSTVDIKRSDSVEWGITSEGNLFFSFNEDYQEMIGLPEKSITTAGKGKTVILVIRSKNKQVKEKPKETSMRTEKPVFRTETPRILSMRKSVSVPPPILMQESVQPQKATLTEDVSNEKQFEEARKHLEQLFGEVESDYNIYLIEAINRFLNDNPDATSEEIIDKIQQIQSDDSIEVFEEGYKIPPSLEGMQAEEENFKHRQELNNEIELAFRRAAYGHESFFKVLARKILGLAQSMPFEDPYTVNEPNTKAFIEIVNNIKADNDLILVKKIYEFVTKILPIFERSDVMCRNFETLITQGKAVCRERSPLLVYALKLRGIDAKIITSNAVGEGAGHMWVTVTINVNNKLVEFDLDPTWYREFIPLHERFKGVEEERARETFEAIWKQYEGVQGKRYITEPEKASEIPKETSMRTEKPKEVSSTILKTEVPGFLAMQKPMGASIPILKQEEQKYTQTKPTLDEINRRCKEDKESLMREALERDFYKDILDLCDGKNLSEELTAKVVERLRSEYASNGSLFRHYIYQFGSKVFFSEIQKIYSEDKTKLSLSEIYFLVNFGYDDPKISESIASFLMNVSLDKELNENFRIEVQKLSINFFFYLRDYFEQKKENPDFTSVEENTYDNWAAELIKELDNKIDDVKYVLLASQIKHNPEGMLDFSVKFSVLTRNFGELSLSEILTLTEAVANHYKIFRNDSFVNNFLIQIESSEIPQENKDDIIRILITHLSLLNLQKETLPWFNPEALIESIAKNSSEAVKNYANTVLILMKKAEIVNFEENTVLIDQVLLFIKDNIALFGDKAISSEKIIDFIQQIQGEDWVTGLHSKSSLETVQDLEKRKYYSYGIFDIYKFSYEGSSFIGSLLRTLSKIITFNYEDYKNPYTPQEPLSAAFLDKIRHLESKNELELVMKIYSLAEDMVKVYELHSEFCKPMEEVLLKGNGVCRDFAALLYHALKERGIDVKYVDGFTEKITEGHIWVRVRITVENIPMEFDLDPTGYKEFFPLHPREFKIDNEQAMNYFKEQAFEQPVFLAMQKPMGAQIPILKQFAPQPPQVIPQQEEQKSNVEEQVNKLFDDFLMLLKQSPNEIYSISLFNAFNQIINQYLQDLRNNGNQEEQQKASLMIYKKFTQLRESKPEIFEVVKRNYLSLTTNLFNQMSPDDKKQFADQLFNSLLEQYKETGEQYIINNAIPSIMDFLVEKKIEKVKMILDLILTQIEGNEQNWNTYYLPELVRMLGYPAEATEKVYELVKKETSKWEYQDAGACYQMRARLITLLIHSQIENKNQEIQEINSMVVAKLKRLPENMLDRAHYGPLYNELMSDIEALPELQPLAVDLYELLMNIFFQRMKDNFQRPDDDSFKQMLYNELPSLLKLLPESMKQEKTEELFNILILLANGKRSLIEDSRQKIRQNKINELDQNKLGEYRRLLAALLNVVETLGFPKEKTETVYRLVKELFTIMSNTQVNWKMEFNEFEKMVKIIDVLGLDKHKEYPTILRTDNINSAESVGIGYMIGDWRTMIKVYIMNQIAMFGENNFFGIIEIAKLFTKISDFVLSIPPELEELNLDKKKEALSDVLNNILKAQNKFEKREIPEEFFVQLIKSINSLPLDEQTKKEFLLEYFKESLKELSTKEQTYSLLKYFLENLADEQKEFVKQSILEFIEKRYSSDNVIDMKAALYDLARIGFDDKPLLDDFFQKLSNDQILSFVSFEEFAQLFSFFNFELIMNKLVELKKQQEQTYSETTKAFIDVLYAVLNKKLNSAFEEGNKEFLTYVRFSIQSNEIELLGELIKSAWSDLSEEEKTKILEFSKQKYLPSNITQYVEFSNNLPDEVALQIIKELYENEQEFDKVINALTKERGLFENDAEGAYEYAIGIIIDELIKIKGENSVAFIKKIIKDNKDNSKIVERARKKLETLSEPRKTEDVKEGLKGQKEELKVIKKIKSTVKFPEIEQPAQKPVQKSAEILKSEEKDLTQEKTIEEKSSLEIPEPEVPSLELRPLFENFQKITEQRFEEKGGFQNLGESLAAYYFGQIFMVLNHEEGHAHVTEAYAAQYDLGINVGFGTLTTNKNMPDLGLFKGLTRQNARLTEKQYESITLGGFAASQELYCRVNEGLVQNDDGSFENRVGHWIAFTAGMDFPVHCLESYTSDVVNYGDIDYLIKQGYETDIKRALVADVIGKAPDLYWHFTKGLGMETSRPDWFSFRIPGTNFRLKISARAFIDPQNRIIAPYVEGEITSE
ncbi:transglutaminase domain-containing protein [Candidatus Woesearchaeota archaeon]|nr:transglutaminase domain-containing protein [Candidatus Woesearchaeota archaeon]